LRTGGSLRPSFGGVNRKLIWSAPAEHGVDGALDSHITTATLIEIAHNLRSNPMPNRNRNTIPNHPVSIVVTSAELEVIRHTLQPRVLSHRIRPRAMRKPFVSH
jgi:hypothetical protein